MAGIGKKTKIGAACAALLLAYPIIDTVIGSGTSVWLNERDREDAAKDARQRDADNQTIITELQESNDLARRAAEEDARLAQEQIRLLEQINRDKAAKIALAEREITERINKRLAEIAQQNAAQPGTAATQLTVQQALTDEAAIMPIEQQIDTVRATSLDPATRPEKPSKPPESVIPEKALKEPASASSALVTARITTQSVIGENTFALCGFDQFVATTSDGKVYMTNENRTVAFKPKSQFRNWEMRFPEGEPTEIFDGCTVTVRQKRAEGIAYIIITAEQYDTQR